MKTELQVEDVHIETPVQGPQAWQQMFMKNDCEVASFWRLAQKSTSEGSQLISTNYCCSAATGSPFVVWEDWECDALQAISAFQRLRNGWQLMRRRFQAVPLVVSETIQDLVRVRLGDQKR